MLNKTPPNSLDAEQAVLGAVLRDNEALAKATDTRYRGRCPSWEVRMGFSVGTALPRATMSHPSQRRTAFPATHCSITVLSKTS